MPRLRRVRALLGLLAALSATLPRAHSLAAQGRVELGPFLAFFTPLSSYEGRIGPVLPGSNNYKHQVTVAYGIDSHFWRTDRLGLAVQLGFSSSDVRQEQISGATSVPASVWWLGGSLAVRLTPPNLPNDVRLRAGAGYLQHRGPAFKLYSSPGAVTALFGIGATWPLQSRLRLAVGFDGYLYSLQLTDTLGTRYRARFQSDMVARVGLLWSPVAKGAAPN